jgi:hypothetical protein
MIINILRSEPLRKGRPASDPENLLKKLLTCTGAGYTF